VREPYHVFGPNDKTLLPNPPPPRRGPCRFFSSHRITISLSGSQCFFGDFFSFKYHVRAAISPPS